MPLEESHPKLPILVIFTWVFALTLRSGGAYFG
jgi:hypothetical protein